MSTHKSSQTEHGIVPKSNVSNLDNPFITPAPFDPVKPETALWRAVITQALMDAGSNSRKPEAVQEKKQAIRWLLGNSEDFITVCLNADLEPGYVRSKAITAIERGCIWRQGMAEKRLGNVTRPLYEKKSALPPLFTPRLVHNKAPTSFRRPAQSFYARLLPAALCHSAGH